MKVLSLFDGISCGQVALHRAGFSDFTYFASEIEKTAITVTQSNFPKTIQLGCVQTVRKFVELDMFNDVDLLIGGSPCQGFSKSGKNLGFNDPRSQLLFDFIAIKNHIKPRWFLLENVRLKQADQDLVSAMIGVQPVLINSNLFSAQNRLRTYWTNIPIVSMIDLKVRVMSVIDYDNKTPNTATWHSWYWSKYNDRITNSYIRVVNDFEKSATLIARMFSNWKGNIYRIDVINYRFLTPVECERLQTLPDDYTASVSKHARYKHLGNGWTVDVIAHILRGMR